MSKSDQRITGQHDKKSPNQSPVDFYKSKPFGGPLGFSKQKVGDQLTGGPMREQIMGRKSLKK